MFAFIGCSGPKVITDFQAEKITLAELNDTLTARNEYYSPIIGRMSLFAQTATQEITFTADYYYAAPDSFRANIRGFLGASSGAVVILGDSMTVYFPSRETLFVACGAMDGQNSILGLSLGPNELIDGIFAIIDYNPEKDSLISFERENANYILFYEKNDQFIRAEFLPSAWTTKSMQVFNESGSVIDIGYDDFISVENIIRPTKIEMTNPMRNEKVEIKIEKEKLVNWLPDNIFELDIPEDIEIWKL